MASRPTSNRWVVVCLQIALNDDAGPDGSVSDVLGFRRGSVHQLSTGTAWPDRAPRAPGALPRCMRRGAVAARAGWLLLPGEGSTAPSERAKDSLVAQIAESGGGTATGAAPRAALDQYVYGIPQLENAQRPGKPSMPSTSDAVLVLSRDKANSGRYHGGFVRCATRAASRGRS
jgi:hypothetical protein